MLNLFDYTDYRKYLADYYNEARKNNSGFSHRYFAQKAGFSSSGLFSNIVTGRRNLTDPLIRKFSRALKLSKKEERFFESLVKFNQAVSIDDKNNWYEKMLQLSPLKVEVLNRDRYAFYARWWYCAIRELLYYFPFKDDYSALARQLDPPISVEQAREAIVLLEKLNMIKKDKKGFYRQTDAIVTSGDHRERSLNIQNFQVATMDLAKKSLQYHSKERRHISTLTLTLSPESEQKARMEIEALQQRLLAMAKEDQNVNSVFQFNFQLFPLTRYGHNK